MPDKFQAELAAALSKRKSLDESPFDELDDLLGQKKVRNLVYFVFLNN